PRLPARRQPVLPHRVRARLPRHHAGAAARSPAHARRAAAPPVAGGGAMTDLLAVTGLTKTFGGVRAVDDCSLVVRNATITGLIGPNGSGKTTVFNIVTGHLRADAGRVEFAGRNVTGYDTGRLYRHGLSRTFQQARVFPQLTVRENLVVAGGHPWWRLFTRWIAHADRARADQLLEEFRLAPLADAPAAELSYGQRKLLEFAAVLM